MAGWNVDRFLGGGADVQKIVTPDLEKSFSKQTQDMKNIIDQAVRQGVIKVVANRIGHKVALSKIQPHTNEPK